MFTIDIPELEYENVTAHAKAVKVGDVVISKGARHKVAEVKRGPKWTTLLDKVGGTILRLENEDPLLVHTPTEASRKAVYQAEYVKYVNEDLRTKLDKYERGTRTKKAMAELQKEVDAGYVLRSYLVEGLIEAQAKDQVQDAYYATLKRVLEQNPDTDLEAWTKEYKDELGKTLITRMRGLSRSTSVTTNAMDDALNEATASFIRDIFWM